MKYGWKRQLPDFRDYKYKASAYTLKALPPMVDLRDKCPPVVNQGSLGSCTANAIGSDHHFEQLVQGFEGAFAPSRLFIYYNERDMEGTVNEDSGAYIRDGLKCVANQGVCAETMWPYDTSKFRAKPSQECYDVAVKHQATSYHAVTQTLNEMKGCLSEGFPFVFGFSVYDSFETDVVKNTGVMPMPGPNESLLGGHAVMAVGYDDARQVFIVRNSWGEGWGDKGYFYMPYAYIADANMASDFWTIRLVEDEDGNQPQPPQPQPQPEPDPKWPCDWAFSATKAFVDGAVGHANKVSSVTTNGMIEAGLRGLQQHLGRVEAARNRRK